jgi:hypothetical protein
MHGTDIDKSPIIDAAIALCGQCQDLHFRIAAQQKPAKARPDFRILQGQNQIIRTCALNQFCDFRFVLGFADDFDIGLIPDRTKSFIKRGRFATNTLIFCTILLRAGKYLLFPSKK